MRRTSAAFLSLLFLAACQQPATQSGPAAQSDEGRSSPSALERAARDTGLVADPGHIPPVGLYQQRHEAGRNLLCVRAGQDGRYRFGAEATFGADEVCHGTGAARRAGDKLILRFAGRSQCTIVAQYDGDRVMMPGVVDVNCARLCVGGASFEGVAFPRIAGDERAAAAARDRDGGALCEN